MNTKAQPTNTLRGADPKDVDALRAALKAGKFKEERDRKFANDLVQRFDTNALTLGMVPWVGRLAQKIKQPVGALPPVRGVVELLDKAKAAGLKRPKLWLQLPDGTPVRVTVAGEKSSTPGHLTLTDGESFGSNRFFGKIAPDGVLTLGGDGYDVQKPLVELLKRLASDPAHVAAEFGHLTGHCCFCSLPLTDERSVMVGYGQTCAEKYGLDWGARPVEKTAAKKRARK